MDGKALLKATIFSKSHEYYQILSSLRAPHYCAMGDYNKYGGTAARLGKTAVGRAKIRLRRCPLARRGCDKCLRWGRASFSRGPTGGVSTKAVKRSMA